MATTACSAGFGWPPEPELAAQQPAKHRSTAAPQHSSRPQHRSTAAGGTAAAGGGTAAQQPAV